jgi:hypothetical protein
MQVVVGHPLKDVCLCWQESDGIQWESCYSNSVIVLGLNKEDLWRQPSPPCKEDIGLALRNDMQHIHVTVRKLQGVSAAKVCVTREPNCVTLIYHLGIVQ